MRAAERRARITSAAVAVIGWGALVALVVIDTAREPGTPMPPGHALGAVLAVGLAISGTVGSVLLHALPRLYATWRDGVQMGQEMSSWHRRHDDVAPFLRAVGERDARQDPPDKRRGS